MITIKQFRFFILCISSLCSGHSYGQLTIKLNKPDLLLAQVMPLEIAVSPSLSYEEQQQAEFIQQQLDKQNYALLLAELPARLTSPASTAMQYFLGQIALKQKQPQQAAHYFSQALQAQPNYAKAMVGLGLVKLQQEQHQQAIELFSQALKLGINNPDLYSYLGFSYMEQQQYLSATLAFEQAKLVAPTDEQINHALVYCYSNSKRLSSALALVEQMLGQNPHHGQLWLQRANIYLQQQDYASTLSSLETAIRLGQRNSDNIALTAQLQLQYGSISRAMILYQTLLTSREDNHPLVAEAINYLLDSHHLKQAEQLLKLSHKKPTKQPLISSELSYLTGKLRLKQNRVTQAIEAYQQALADNAVHGYALLELAQLYRQQGHSHKAQMLLLRASEITEVKLQALTAHADLQAELGQLKQALKLLRQAQRIAPNQQILLDNIATLTNMIKQQQG